MNKIILSIALACISGITATAQVTGDGYYRVKNVTTQRYMSLSDNTSRGIDYATTTADASALLTKKNWDEVSTDPGTVFYIQKVNNDEYNIKSQGASLYDMIHRYIRLKYFSNQNVYRAWQQESGVTIYLSDEYDYTQNRDEGYVDNGTVVTYNWSITAVDTEDNYIGVKPIVKSNGKYYATFYAGYPFSLASDGMKVYYINQIDEQKGYAIYKELTGIIPASTPVVIECSSENPANNKLKPEVSNPASLKDNKLTGVFFSVGSRVTAHYNSTEFNPETMRVLGVAADGSLTFNNQDTYMCKTLIKVGYNYPSITAIPHNTGYLKVSSSCPTELKFVDETTGINTVTTNDNKPAPIYNLNGIKVRENATSAEGLAKGIYIFKGKKIVVE